MGRLLPSKVSLLMPWPLTALASLILLAAIGYGIRWNVSPSVAVKSQRGSTDRADARAAAAAGRMLSAPAHVEVAVADVAGASADQGTVDQPVVAEVGRPDLLPAAPTVSAQHEESQSDGQVSGTSPESADVGAAVLAPVPVQDDGQAMVNVSLALLVTDAHSASHVQAIVPKLGQRSTVDLAVIAHPGAQSLKAHLGNLHNQINVASGRHRIFVPSASFIAATAAPGAAIPNDWPLIDETPIAEPTALLSRLSADDPLKVIATNWCVDANTHSPRPASTPATSSASQMENAIARASEPWQLLYQMGRVSAVLDSPSLVQPFWRAAVLRAAAQAQDHTVTRADVQSMQVLASTCLWIWKDDVLAARALGALLRWQKLSAPRAAEAKLLLTDALGRLAER